MRLIPLLAVLVLSGCSLPAEPGASRDVLASGNGSRELGAIAGFQSGDPHVAIDVQGRTVTVTVHSYGNGCYSVAETEVRLSGMDAVVSPYDWNPGCPQRDLKTVVHATSMGFGASGTAHILVRGIDASTRSSRNLVGDTITVRRTVLLR
jgi:hypothetical protein